MGAAALLLVAAPALFWRGGVLEEEAIGFLGNYWGERSIPQRILDPRGYDFYQGRELSYAVDFLDAQWTRLVLSTGRTWFIPPSAVAASLAVVAAWLGLAPRAFPALGRATSALLLLVYLSNFAVLSTMGLLYRSAKPLVTPLLLTLLLYALAEHRHPRAARGAAFGVAFALSLTMSLLDRQGLFYAAGLALVLGVAWLRERRPPAILLGTVAAIATALVYNYLLGPWLIHAVNGYWPSLRFQRIRPGRLASPRLWVEALHLLGDWTSVLLGSLPVTLLAGAAVSLLALYLARGGRDRLRARTLGALGLAVAAVAQLAMVAIMVERHEPVTWVDHRTWYYPLPYQAVLLVGLAWGLERPGVARGSPVRAAPLLLLLVGANLAQWPERTLIMESGPWFGDVCRRSARLERSLATGQADTLLDGDYRAFFFDCLGRFPRLGARAGPLVREGSGVERVGVRDGRLFAWAQRESHVAASAPVAGRHHLAGGLWLRPGETVSILLGTQPPRLVTEVSHSGLSEGREFFSFTASLPAGRTDVLLLSRLPEMEIRRDGERIPVAFGLLLPFTLWREGPPAAPVASAASRELDSPRPDR